MLLLHSPNNCLFLRMVSNRVFHTEFIGTNFDDIASYWINYRHAYLLTIEI